mmetsp:Transcript_61510/g.199067  ORF Transcript_61510/g.199067 Transcript_61510/m.199067 type:complete len:141 (+) Transcript_61510:33-455(+)
MRDELSIPAYTFEVYVPRPPLRAKYPVDEALEPLLQRRFCNACGKEDRSWSTSGPDDGSAMLADVYVPRPPLRAKYPVDEALEPLLQRRFCNACGKEDAKLMCGRCRIVRYCSEDCRQQVARLTRLAISESMWIHIVACL